MLAWYYTYQDHIFSSVPQTARKVQYHHIKYSNKIYIIVNTKFSKLENEYRDCIKRKWRQDWDCLAYIPTRMDVVPQFVIKAL